MARAAEDREKSRLIDQAGIAIRDVHFEIPVCPALLALVVSIEGNFIEPPAEDLVDPPVLS